MPDDMSGPAPIATGPVSRAPRQRSLARDALPWVLGAAVVLVLAVTAGLLTAYVVASMRSVPPPAGLASLPPGQTSPSVVPSAGSPLPSFATAQPRRTPTPPAEPTPEATPLVHIVVRGESISYIAGVYCTTVDAIVSLNNLTNANRIFVGQQLLIPPPGCVEETASPSAR